MALNKARVGYRYPTYRYEIAREKVREYAVALGLDEPQYAAEEGDVVAPPTFAACFTLRLEPVLADAELGAHPRLVHGSQEFDISRPLRVGDVLLCTPMLAEIRSVGRNDLLTIAVDCVDAANGERVVTSRSTILFFESPAQSA